MGIPARRLVREPGSNALDVHAGRTGMSHKYWDDRFFPWHVSQEAKDLLRKLPKEEADIMYRALMEAYDAGKDGAEATA